MGNFILWTDKKTSYEMAANGIRKLFGHGEVKLLGVTGSERRDVAVNGQRMLWVPCEEIQDMPYDYILYFGGEPFSKFEKTAKKLWQLAEMVAEEKIISEGGGRSRRYKIKEDR